MGSLVNAAGSKSPLIALVGQQGRAALPTPALLVNRNPISLAQGAVKHTAEPSRAEDTPEILAQAIVRAAQAPSGPVCVSVPMDDWDRPLASSGETPHDRPLTVHPVAAPDALDALAGCLASAKAPA